MKAKATYRWYRLRAGSHTMTSWIGDAQLTYLALHKESGWVLTRSVAGAGVTVLGGPMATLRAAKALAAADLQTGML